MFNLVAFQVSWELEELTGLTRDELWDVGFDLDDWDIGFQCDKPIFEHVPVEKTSFWDGSKYTDYEMNLLDYDDCPVNWLASQLYNYCVGPSYTFYNGKHYYLAHHS